MICRNLMRTVLWMHCLRTDQTETPAGNSLPDARDLETLYGKRPLDMG